MKLPGQKPLGLRVRGDDDLAGFVAADGIVASIKATVLADEDAFGCVYVHGEEGSGKTHLLNGIARAALSQGRDLFFLDTDQPAEWGNIADDLAPGTLVICDSIDAGTLATSNSIDAGKTQSSDNSAPTNVGLDSVATQHKTAAMSSKAANSTPPATATDQRLTPAPSDLATEQDPSLATAQKSAPATNQGPAPATEQSLPTATEQVPSLAPAQKSDLATKQSLFLSAGQNPTLFADQSPNLTAELASAPTTPAGAPPTTPAELAPAPTTPASAPAATPPATPAELASASVPDAGAAVALVPAQPSVTLVANDTSVSSPMRDREEGLWILYLRAEARGLRLLLSAHTSPQQTISRPELASRLAGQLVVALSRLDGDGLRKMVFGKFARRSLRTSDLALDYLLNHGSRETKKLDDIVAAVDELCQTRRSANVTIPILKQVLHQS
ncbi:MAG: hypothetical protein K0U66_03430 [Gammaproteobacteria bacterium]|nr:hypothetical protein [Gammaproteobacteria bacterium]